MAPDYRSSAASGRANFGSASKPRPSAAANSSSARASNSGARNRAATSAASGSSPGSSARSLTTTAIRNVVAPALCRGCERLGRSDHRIGQESDQRLTFLTSEQPIQGSHDTRPHLLGFGACGCWAAVEERERARPHVADRIQREPLLPPAKKVVVHTPVTHAGALLELCGLVASNPRSASREHAAATSFCFESYPGRPGPRRFSITDLHRNRARLSVYGGMEKLSRIPHEDWLS